MQNLNVYPELVEGPTIITSFFKFNDQLKNDQIPILEFGILSLEIVVEV